MYPCPVQASLLLKQLDSVLNFFDRFIPKLFVVLILWNFLFKLSHFIISFVRLYLLLRKILNVSTAGVHHNLGHLFFIDIFHPSFLNAIIKRMHFVVLLRFSVYVPMASSKPELAVIHTLFLVATPRHLIFCLIQITTLSTSCRFSVLDLICFVVDYKRVKFAFLYVNLFLVEWFFFNVFVSFNLVCWLINKRRLLRVILIKPIAPLLFLLNLRLTLCALLACLDLSRCWFEAINIEFLFFFLFCSFLKSLFSWRRGCWRISGLSSSFLFWLILVL